MVSMGGLEPPRISPHAPQTCAYTDSATSTFNFQLETVVQPHDLFYHKHFYFKSINFCFAKNVFIFNRQYPSDMVGLKYFHQPLQLF